MLLSASESAAAPAAPIWLPHTLHEEKRVRDARGETGPPAKSRAIATYLSDVSVALLLSACDSSVALLLSASESAAAPASPIWLCISLQRIEEGQGCSWREKATGTSRAHVTYVSDVIELNAFASSSLFLPLVSS